MTAGAIEFTVMSPCPTNSLASDFVKAIKAALLAEYGPSVGLPSLPSRPKKSAMVGSSLVLCNAFVGRPFQADVCRPDSLNLGRPGQAGKPDLRMRCKASSQV